MNILMVSPNLTPFYATEGIIGGMETYVVNLAQALARRKETITLVTGSRKDEQRNIGQLTILGLKSINFSPFNKGNPFFLNAKPFISSKFDVVHVHQLYTLSSMFGCAISKIRNTPSILTDHGGGAKSVAVLRGFTASFPTAFATVSKFSSDWLTFLYPRANTFEVYGGVDVERFHPLNDLRDMAIRLKLAGSSVILSVGRIAAFKGIDVLIGALQYLPSTTKLLVVGPCRDKRYFQYLLQLSLKIAPGRVFFTGSIPEEELPKYINLCDVFVMPSVQTDYLGHYYRLPELLGLAKLEAMACGKPVVVSSVCGLPEFVFSGKNGFVVPERSEKRLAEAILTILDDDKLRRKMSADGLKLINDYFTWDKVASRVVEVYKKYLP